MGFHYKSHHRLTTWRQNGKIWKNMEKFGKTWRNFKIPRIQGIQEAVWNTEITSGFWFLQEIQEIQEHWDPWLRHLLSLSLFLFWASSLSWVSPDRWWQVSGQGPSVFDCRENRIAISTDRHLVKKLKWHFWMLQWTPHNWKPNGATKKNVVAR